jgi:hypothetical protein
VEADGERFLGFMWEHWEMGSPNVGSSDIAQVDEGKVASAGFAEAGGSRSVVAGFAAVVVLRAGASRRVACGW